MKWIKIASTFCGSEGQPGNTYTLLILNIKRSPVRDGKARYRGLAHWGCGSNQGHLEEHQSQDFEVRSDEPGECVDMLEKELMVWINEDECFPESEIRQACRELRYEMEDDDEL